MMVSPGSRPGRHVPESATILYAGTNTSRTYDLNTAVSWLDSCVITVPGSCKPRVFSINGFFKAGFGHGTHCELRMDGASIGAGYGQFYVDGSASMTNCSLGPVVVVVPGDGKPHLLGIWAEDAGATGNLVFQERWVTAQQMGPQ